MKDMKIAAVTCRSIVGDMAHNLAQIDHWTRHAHHQGVHLICFPEMSVTGYCNHADIAAVAQPIKGDIIRQISKLAQRYDIIILAGMAERNPEGPPYATHCVIYPDGKIQAYRKLHLAPNEKSFFTAGRQIPLFTSAHATFGIQLCYDGHFPELSTAMTAKGAQVIFLPHASPRGDAQSKHQSWMRHLPARAYDNGIFVVACNPCGDNGRGLAFPGHAVVLDPSGAVLHRTMADRADMLVSLLKADRFQHVRAHPMRHFFPNRRPELYLI